jgi:peptidyl-prolyl cis-trans isomerase SurA
MKNRHEDITVKDNTVPRRRIYAIYSHCNARTAISSVCTLHGFSWAIFYRYYLISCLVVISVVSLLSTQASAEIIDRLLVAVNGKVIAEGDLKLARSLNSILTHDNVSAKLPDEDEIQRFIDLELLRQELENFSDVTGVEEEIEGQMEELRKTYAKEGGLTAILERLGLQESELRAYLSLQVSILKLIDFRFRPFVSVTDDEIQQYYLTKFVPQVKPSVADIPALEEVSSKIREILTEEKVNDSLNQWLQDSRRHAQIEYFGENETKPEGAEK